MKKEKPKNDPSKKNNSKKKDHKKQSLNKKRRNSKILKAKKVLAENREALKNGASAQSTDVSRRKKILRIVRKVFFWLIIVFLAALLISFVVIKINDGMPTMFGYSIQRVSSGSMEPELQVGDLIFSKDVKSPDEINVGDIVTFKGDADFDFKKVTHRVIEVPAAKNGERFFITKGDANKADDGEIPFSAIQSKMRSKLDFAKKIYDVFLSPWGLLIFIAALIMIYFDELLTLAKVLTGNYDPEENEEYREEIERERIEEEKRRKEEELRKYKRANWKKYDNTSKRKKKNRKKNKKKERVNRFADD